MLAYVSSTFSVKLNQLIPLLLGVFSIPLICIPSLYASKPQRVNTNQGPRATPIEKTGTIKRSVYTVLSPTNELLSSSTKSIAQHLRAHGLPTPLEVNKQKSIQQSTAEASRNKHDPHSKKKYAHQIIKQEPTEWVADPLIQYKDVDPYNLFLTSNELEFMLNSTPVDLVPWSTFAKINRYKRYDRDTRGQHTQNQSTE